MHVECAQMSYMTYEQHNNYMCWMFQIAFFLNIHAYITMFEMRKETKKKRTRTPSAHNGFWYYCLFIGMCRGRNTSLKQKTKQYNTMYSIDFSAIPFFISIHVLSANGLPTCTNELYNFDIYIVFGDYVQWWILLIFIVNKHIQRGLRHK